MKKKIDELRECSDEAGYNQRIEKVTQIVKAARWKMAAADPLLIKDIEETEEVFKSADSESAMGIN
jgi:hypothetical protein